MCDYEFFFKILQFVKEVYLQKFVEVVMVKNNLERYEVEYFVFYFVN